MSEYSVEEVRARFERWVESTDMHLAHGKSYFHAAECQLAWRAYQAAYAERIKADEGAGPVAWISHQRVVGIPDKDFYGALPVQSLQPGVYSHTPLFAHPPAQAAQVIYRPHAGECQGPGACEECSRAVGCCFRGDYATPECMRTCPCPDPRDPANKNRIHPMLPARPAAEPVAQADATGERAAFEKWLIDVHEYPPDDLVWLQERNCYADYGMHLAWQSWQESAQPRASHTAAPSPAQSVGPAVPSYQARVGAWITACFGEGDETDRVHRFVEEALELAQSLSCSQSEVLQLVEYVYNRPIGDPDQEVGGVMVTLGALCHAAKMDMVDCGERELTRVWANTDRIRVKHATKPRFSPLPGSARRECPHAPLARSAR